MLDELTYVNCYFNFEYQILTIQTLSSAIFVRLQWLQYNPKLQIKKIEDKNERKKERFIYEVEKKFASIIINS